MSKNHYKKAFFIIGAYKLEQLPDDDGAEVVFAGRSNAGKSSVLNALSNHSGLARTSKTPGRTQQINVFELDKSRRLLDLPGYGYAKVPIAIRQHWGKTLRRFFSIRQSLCGLVLVMDIRHPFKASDEQLLDWCQTASLPVHILLNKADKLSRGASLDVLRKSTHRVDRELISLQLFSVPARLGIEEARQKLDKWFSYDEDNDTGQKKAPV